MLLTALLMCFSLAHDLRGQSFSQSNLQFDGAPGVSNGTSLMFGPDDRLYVLNINGTIDIYSIQRNGVDDYTVIDSEKLLDVKNIPNHNDDGAFNSGNNREATGLTVTGTAANPIIYVTSSDSRVGGPSGDANLDTNSGVITRLTWNGSGWEVVDIVRGLPRSEENHATNGLEIVTIGATDYLIVCSGGHTNAGSPSDNFAWTTEYALSAAILSVNLTQLEAMDVKTDAVANREYIYDLPTLDDPTRANSNGIIDPDAAGYDGIDVGDPWGGNDGLNQAMVVIGGPVQVFSAGFRNSYDLVVTASGRVYCTDNGANGGWGGLPVNEGTASVTNDYVAGEPGSTEPVGDEQVNNKDHLTLITGDIQSYVFNSFYGGHAAPIRANPAGAGLFTNPTFNGLENSIFRTLIYDPTGLKGEGFTSDPEIALPANWPPVPTALADVRQADWRGPDLNNPDGPNDELITVWGTNTNGIDEYTASNFGGAMQGDLIAGKNGGILRRVQLNSDGGLEEFTPSFISNLGGNALGVTCNGDNDPFPGTIWVAPFNGTIKILEPQDLNCFLPSDAEYTAEDDNDLDGYTNQDEIDNKNDDQSIEDVICNGGSQPNDFDKPAGGVLVSDLNDDDDDNDNVLDASDPFQLGDPTAGGSDAFTLPVLNDLLSDNQELGGYFGLGFTGLMNNGTANPNWLNWLDRRDDPNDPNPNDILGGAVGAMTMQMTAGTALGSANTQEKAFQYGVQVDQSTGTFTVEGRLFNFNDNLQLYSTGNGEVGIFIGDGSQSNYIKLVLTSDNTLEALQEINDVAQTPLVANVTAAQDIIMYYDIDPATGSVTLRYEVDGGGIATLGTMNAQGSILSAIQTSGTDLAVGLIGSSNEAGVEVEGTWDYLYVQSPVPFVEQVLPDVDALVSGADIDIDLDDFFGDDEGDDNLTYSVVSNTDNSVGTSIGGSTLTVTIPSNTATAVVTIRATDEDNLSVDQSFTVRVSDEPVPVLRLRANGPTIAATDGDNPDWVGIQGGGAQSGAFNGLTYGVNTGNLSTHNITGRHSSLPAYVPQAVFTSERWDPGAAPEMEFTIGLPNGDYFVRLYLANGFAGTAGLGSRVFDVLIEGEIVEDDFDPVASFGHQTGGMVEHPVTLEDGNLNIAFERTTENPLINGIEILSVGELAAPITIGPIADQTDREGEEVIAEVMAFGGDPNENFAFSASGLPPGVGLEPTTGVFFGEVLTGASDQSPYTTIVTVSKPGSNPVQTTFNWTILEPVVDAVWNEQNDDENHTARHECSFVQAGDKFYLFGGREGTGTLDVFDYQSKSWNSIAKPTGIPAFNHFQAVEYQGLIWVIGAFKDNNFPVEAPADFVYAYNPANDEWIQGPEIPAGRKRGSTGLVMHDDKFYIVGGNTIGHDGGFVAWFDEFDPATGVWTALADSPRPRDHFHAEVLNGKLYVAGGRLSGGQGGTFAPLIAEVDVYDFAAGTWSQVADLPTPRAAASVASFGNELYVIGGEIETDLQGNVINDAVSTTEAYDPAAGTWTTKAELITERHGTQAIVSGDGIHITAGSNSKGGSGTMKNMEFFGTDNPAGNPLTASQVQVPASANVTTTAPATVTVSVTGGNAATVITGVNITGPNGSAFTLPDAVEFALLEPGASLGVEVGFIGSADATAELVIAYGSSSTAVVQLNGTAAAAGTVLYRVNAGGVVVPSHDSDPVDWSADQATANAGGSAATGTPSEYYNTTPPAADQTFGVAFTGDNATVYPDALFATERYSSTPNPNSMQWDFPVANGDYTVNLLFAEVWSGAIEVGTRVFDVEIEGNIVIEELDQTESYGHNTAAVATFLVSVTDGNLDIDFIKGTENPNIKGIEIIGGGNAANNTAPLVSVPADQVGAEGATVSLQIDATDEDACTGLTYSATGLPPGLSIDASTGLISGTLEEATGDGSGVAGAFIEEDGIVVIEMESAASLPASWQTASTYSTASTPDINAPNSATGGDFIVWQGPQSTGTPGNALITYPVKITQTGEYRLQWRNQVGLGANSTEHNDTWVKIESDAFFGTKNNGESIVCPRDIAATENECMSTETLEGSSSDGWFKVYSSGAQNWKWSTNTSDNNAHQIFARFDEPGIYNILISVRSSSHAIDRMVLHHTSAFSGNPQSLSLPQSDQTIGGNAGAAVGSPHAVSITVADGCIPSLSTSVSFIWEVSDQQSTGSLAITTTSQGRNNDHSGAHTVELYDLNDLSTPAYTYSPSANAAGVTNVSGFVPGTYRVMVTRAGYLRRVQELTLGSGNNSADFGQLLAGDLNADNLINIQDLGLLSGTFGQSGQASDVNGDEVTNIQDLGLLSSNFGTSGESIDNN